MASRVLVPRRPAWREAAMNLPAVIDARTELPARSTVAEMHQQVEKTLRPAGRPEAAKAAAVLIASFKIADVVADPQAFLVALVDELAGYPIDVLDHAIHEARRGFRWLPSICEVVEICEAAMRPRREALARIEATELEIYRRGAAAERRRLAEAEDRRREADFVHHLHGLYGDSAPTPSEVDLAERARPTIAFRGKAKMLHTWLAEAQPWAPVVCRRLAIARRAEVAANRHATDFETAGAIARLTIRNEAEARARIEEIEATTATPPPGHVSWQFSPVLEAAIDAILHASGVSRRP